MSRVEVFDLAASRGVAVSMSSVAPTRLSWIVPLLTSRSLNCTLARRLPGVLWSALVTTKSLPSMMTAWPRRMSLARIDLVLCPNLCGFKARILRFPEGKGRGIYSS